MSAATLEIPLTAPLDYRLQVTPQATTVREVDTLKGACRINTVTDEGVTSVRPSWVYVGPLVGTAGGMYAASPDTTYIVQGTNLYSVNASGGSTLIGTVTASSYLWAAGTIAQNFLMVAASGGGSRYAYVAGVLTLIADPDFPAVIVPACCYLDGTYYVMTSDGSIYGSAFNDATSWDPLNRVNAWQDSSLGVSLIKHRSYIVALKAASLQVFYDAGNPVGSPLLPLLAAQQPVGCVSAFSVQEIHGSHLWVGQMKNNALCVIMMDNLQVSIVSTPSVDRWLSRMIGARRAVNSTQFSAWGHSFYAVTFQGYPTAVYDLNTKTWDFWESSDVGFSAVTSAAFGGGPPGGTVAGKAPTFYYETSAGYYKLQDQPYAIDHSPSNTVVSMPWVDSSASASFAPAVQITTPVVDGGTQAEKTAMRLEIFCDTVGDGALEVCWSDDDYKSWSAPVTVMLSDPRVFLDDLGTFRRRAFRFRHLSPTPIRLQRVSLNVLLGSS